MAKKQVKTGVSKGSGPPPGYRWNVFILDLAFVEVMDFLTKEQYSHLSMQFRELAREEDPTHSVSADIDKLADDLYELRDKGGILGKKNIRVFWSILRDEIVVLGGMKKEREGKTPPGTKTTMLRRLRLYRQGEFGGSNES